MSTQLKSASFSCASALRDGRLGVHLIVAVLFVAIFVIVAVPAFSQNSARPDTSDATPMLSDLVADLAQAGEFASPCLSRHFTVPLWSGYADQHAMRKVRLHEAHLAAPGCGSGAVVAIIDTGVDPDHPLLAGALVEGYDFLLDEPGQASEWASSDQSVIAILEQSVIAILESSEMSVAAGVGVFADLGSLGPILDQSVIAILEENVPPPFFGHGTMVAGLVRLAAPGAKIMPLKVFDGHGQAQLADIVAAVDYAVAHGVDVINMSFSMEERSKELEEAISRARQQGVICVGSAGNQSSPDRIYPAALADTIGVGAVDDLDQLAVYSNFGSGRVDLAAPGNGMVSAYPGGLFGAGWGTSFSAPLVSGTAAVFRHLLPGASTETYRAALTAFYQGSELVPELLGRVTSGRLDASSTLEAAASPQNGPVGE